MAKQQSGSLVVTRLKYTNGNFVSDAEEILSCFHDFYTNMYATSLTNNEQEIDMYLHDLQFSTLMAEQTAVLEEDFIEDNVRETKASMAAGKASGPDGLPLGVYSHYMDVMAPILVQVYSNAFQEGRLPLSMYSATVVLIPKPDKDLTDCASYHPI